MKHSPDAALKISNAPLQPVKESSDPVVYERSYLKVVHTIFSQQIPVYPQVIQPVNTELNKAANWDQAWFDNYE